ncbi:MAG: NtaA/DmoA family FMN-dependent monooxygenase [Acidimicrobiia bacterium]|nr:NtaA/DmoA family FMN-dependent monooxygenase [Acidimicrobiia bacterium]
MADSVRTMSLVGFMQASNVTVYSGAWRHPDADPGFLTAGYYQRIGQVLEQGCFDLVFFDDRLAMPGIYGDSVAETVRTGARTVKLDLSVTLGVIAAATRHLGLGATYSTTYYPPFHVARTFATLDHLSAGRAAWNVVTSVNDAEAQNFGVDVHVAHDERYDRADEFLEATFGLWDTWEDGAIIGDKASGTFADPAKVHELNYEGKHYRTRGPLTVPRCPQGRPVIIQAGSSGRGRQFASRWADLVFTNDHTHALALAHYQDQKAQVAALGRDPDAVKVLPLVYVVAAATEAEAAAEEHRLLEELVDPMASLVLLGEVTNLDFSRFGLDEPIPDDFLDTASGIRGFLDGVRAHLPGRALTLRDIAAHRATLRSSPRFVGTGPQIAEEMEHWLASGACDGFVIAATHLPGTFEQVVRYVTPELQRRGLLRDRYEGATLRENLGLARP